MKEKISNRNDEILSVIRENNGIKIKDLARQLEMWDGNLRKRINALVKTKRIEKFVDGENYTCVKIRDK